MTSDEISAILKASLGFLKPFDKDGAKSFNVAVFETAKQLANLSKKELKEAVKKAESNSSSAEFTGMIQQFMENPMSKEEEAKALKAIYHIQLSKGEINTQFLDKYDKIIGVGTEEDDKIELVDFKDAFPDYATAIEICSKPMPKVDSE